MNTNSCKIMIQNTHPELLRGSSVRKASIGGGHLPKALPIENLWHEMKVRMTILKDCFRMVV